MNYQWTIFYRIATYDDGFFVSQTKGEKTYSNKRDACGFCKGMIQAEKESKSQKVFIFLKKHALSELSRPSVIATKYEGEHSLHWIRHRKYNQHIKMLEDYNKRCGVKI